MRFGAAFMAMIVVEKKERVGIAYPVIDGDRDKSRSGPAEATSGQALREPKAALPAPESAAGPVQALRPP
jgi:hypothetical protein